MYEAVSNPNYYPENISLTPEDENIFNLRWRKEDYKAMKNKMA